jgi:hypothetical protein
MAEMYESALPLALTLSRSNESSASIIVRLVWTLVVPARKPKAVKVVIRAKGGQNRRHHHLDGVDFCQAV